MQIVVIITIWELFRMQEKKKQTLYIQNQTNVEHRNSNLKSLEHDSYYMFF